MRSNLATAFCAGFLASGAWTLAQTCIVPAPATPPKANQVVVTLPLDGGSTGCTAHAVSTTGSASPSEHSFKSAWCAVARQFGDQAVSVDNGWDDGGVP